jgi:hypothetical protein
LDLLHLVCGAWRFSPKLSLVNGFFPARALPNRLPNDLNGMGGGERRQGREDCAAHALVEAVFRSSDSFEILPEHFMAQIRQRLKESDNFLQLHLTKWQLIVMQ